jgi:hypothetical protein
MFVARTVVTAVRRRAALLRDLNGHMVDGQPLADVLRFIRNEIKAEMLDGKKRIDINTNNMTHSTHFHVQQTSTTLKTQLLILRSVPQGRAPR